MSDLSVKEIVAVSFVCVYCPAFDEFRKQNLMNIFCSLLEINFSVD